MIPRLPYHPEGSERGERMAAETEGTGRERERDGRDSDEKGGE